MTTAVVIPFRPGCPHRDAARPVVVEWWCTITRGEWEIVEADDGGEPFSRGGSINAGIETTDADIIVAADADLLIGRDAIITAADLAAQHPGVVQPFDRLCWYDEKATRRILAEPWLPFTPSKPRPTYDWDADMPTTPLRGGLNVFSRETWERAGGFIAAHRGWGHEDVSFWAQCETLVAPARRITSTVHHLFHPKLLNTTYAALSVQAANKAVAERIAAAAGRPDAMRAVASELGGRPWT